MDRLHVRLNMYLVIIIIITKEKIYMAFSHENYNVILEKKEIETVDIYGKKRNSLHIYWRRLWCQTWSGSARYFCCALRCLIHCSYL